MKNIIQLVLVMFVFSSCATIVTWFRPGNFTYLYEDKYTGIDTLIHVDGYYHSAPDSNFIVHSVLFFRDGSTARVRIKKENKYYDKVNNKNKDKIIPPLGGIPIKGRYYYVSKYTLLWWC